MAEGVCEYKEKQVSNTQPYRVFISESTAKKMNPSFSGMPLYLNHVDDVDVSKIKEESVGYVVESFYNKSDGKNWAKFIVTDNRGEEALKKGFKLSNCYISKQFGGGGIWHGVEYLKEVTDAEYEHLAIVQSPRYKESVVLTPEEFKKYNSEKEIELTRLSNSANKTITKQENKPMKFNFFKKEKMENSADLETMSVILPRSKKEFTIEKMINEVDEMQMNNFANGDAKVKVGEGEMSVNELVEKYNSMCSTQKNSDEAAKKAADEKEKQNSMSDEEKQKMNSMTDEEKKKANEADEEKKKANAAEEVKKEEDKSKNSAHFEKLKNAHNVAGDSERIVDTSYEQVSRGTKRYGSK